MHYYIMLLITGSGGSQQSLEYYIIYIVCMCCHSCISSNLNHQAPNQDHQVPDSFVNGHLHKQRNTLLIDLDNMHHKL